MSPVQNDSPLEENDIAEANSVPSSSHSGSNGWSNEKGRPPRLARVTARRASLFKSPSSPNIKAERDITHSHTTASGTLTRSRTLPRGADRILDLGKASLDPEISVKMRRWILALVIGMRRYDLVAVKDTYTSYHSGI